MSVTGKIVAVGDVGMAFETGGKVSELSISVGNRVEKGMILANVGSRDLCASLLGAQALIQSAQADFESVIMGTRPTEVLNIKNSYDQAKSDLVTSIKSAYITSDDVLRTRIDSLYTNPNLAFPELPNFSNYLLKNKLETERVIIGEMLKSWEKTVNAINTDNYTNEELVTTTTNLKIMTEFLNELAQATSYFGSSDDITVTEATTYTTNISLARTTINTTVSNIAAIKQILISAEGKLNLAKDGSTSEEISRADAAVKNAQASVLQAQASLLKTSIVAPFSGIITKTDLKVGQFVSPGAPVTSMISDAKFGIESYIPEADISKIGIGFTGTTTLDAYGDSAPFQVVVTAIDLSETIVEGVTTYKTTLQFVDTDDRIRSGMTANIDLKSATRQGILSVPQTAIISTKGIRTVLVLDPKNNTQSRVVTTGSIDNAGHIEIKNGLEAGETVVTNPSK